MKRRIAAIMAAMALPRAMVACGGPYRPHLKGPFLRAEIAYFSGRSGSAVIRRTVTNTATIRALVRAVNALRPAHPPPSPPGTHPVANVCAAPAGAPWFHVVLVGGDGRDVTVTAGQCGDIAVQGHAVAYSPPLAEIVKRMVGT